MRTRGDNRCDLQTRLAGQWLDAVVIGLDVTQQTVRIEWLCKPAIESRWTFRDSIVAGRLSAGRNDSNVL